MELLATAKALMAGLKSLSSSYSKDHIALLETKCKLILELIDEATVENQRLTAEVTELKEKLSFYESSVQFAHHSGAAFKKNSDGSYDQTPYCPKCHGPLSATGMLLPFICSNSACRHAANFKRNELKNILSQLPK